MFEDQVNQQFFNGFTATLVFAPISIQLTAA